MFSGDWCFETTRDWVKLAENCKVGGFLGSQNFGFHRVF